MASLTAGITIPEITRPPDTSTGDECVLLIEGYAHDAARILDELASPPEERFRAEWVTQLSSGLERLGRGGVGVVVLDLTLPDSHGVATFDRFFQAAPQVPILIVTDSDAEEMAMKAVQRGARDYLRKDQVDGSRLRRAVRTMMDRRAAAAVLLENAVTNVTLDSIGEAVLRTDFRGKVMYLNRIAEKMTGWSREEALGRPVTEVLRIINGIGGAGSSDASKTAPPEEETTPMASGVNCILIRRDGSECGIENKVTVVADVDGNITGSVLAFHDVSAARANSREMSHLSQHDF